MNLLGENVLQLITNGYSILLHPARCYSNPVYWQSSSYYYRMNYHTLGCDSHCNSKVVYCLAAVTRGIILVLILLNRHKPFARVRVDWTYWHPVLKWVPATNSIWCLNNFPEMTTRWHTPSSKIVWSRIMIGLFLAWALYVVPLMSSNITLGDKLNTQRLP